MYRINKRMVRKTVMLPWRQGVGDKVYENECDTVRIAHPEVSLYLICTHTHTHNIHTYTHTHNTHTHTQNTHNTHTHYIALYIIRPTSYRRAPFFEGYKFREWSKKGSLWKLFPPNDIGRALYNTCELTRNGFCVNFR